MSLHESILETIGGTPIIKLHRLAPPHVALYAKVESFNPGGSVKDRLAIAIVLDAEQRGSLKAGQTGSRRPPAIPASRWRWCAPRAVIRSSR